MELVSRAMNSKTLINVALVGAFGLLSMRSVHQQKVIEAMETERDSLLNSNKAIKKTMWDWKQQLYAEASSPDTAIVPLSTLKSIYQDAPLTNADTGKSDGKSAPSKILI